MTTEAPRKTFEAQLYHKFRGDTRTRFLGSQNINFYPKPGEKLSLPSYAQIGPLRYLRVGSVLNKGKKITIIGELIERKG